MNFKRKTICSIMLILCLCSTACKKESDIPQLDEEFHLGQDSQTFMGESRNTVKTADGYYLNNGDVLFYLDNETKEFVRVCNKTECEHDFSGECDAVMSDFLDSIWMYEDELYLIGSDPAEEYDYWLYKQSKDGSNREKLCYLFTEGSEGLSFIGDIHRGYLYYSVLNSTMDDASERQFYRVKLEKKAESEIVSSVSGYGAMILEINGYGNYIYYKTVAYGDELGNDANRILIRYNVKTKKSEEIYSGEFYDYVIHDNKVYFTNGEVIQVYDMRTKEEEEFYNPSTKVACSFNFDGNYFYIDNENDSYLADMDAKDRTIQIVDKEGKLVKTLNVGNLSHCEYGDENYLFFYLANLDDAIVQDEIIRVYDKSQITSNEDVWQSLTAHIYGNQ